MSQKSKNSSKNIVKAPQKESNTSSSSPASMRSSNKQKQREGISTKRNTPVEEGMPSIKDYNITLDKDADTDEASFSSLPDYIIDVVLNADDETFAQFLAERRLSHNQRIISTDVRDHNDASNTDNRQEDNNNNLAHSGDEESSDPPPLVLPPPGTVKYDESFIEMVTRIVNRNRHEHDDSDDKLGANREAGNISPSLAEKDVNDDMDRIEQARRSEVLLPEEESFFLDKYSIGDEELLFLHDDKVPSFLYNDDDELGASSGHNKTHHRTTALKEQSDDKAITIKDSPYRSPLYQIDDSIRWNDELDKSCNSIDAIELGENDDNEQQEGIQKEEADENNNSFGDDGNGLIEEDEFKKDYSSWFCFDNDAGYVTFKDKCGASSGQDIVQGAEGHHRENKTNNSSSPPIPATNKHKTKKLSTTPSVDQLENETRISPLHSYFDVLQEYQETSIEAADYYYLPENQRDFDAVPLANHSQQLSKCDLNPGPSASLIREQSQKDDDHTTNADRFVTISKKDLSNEREKSSSNKAIERLSAITEKSFYTTAYEECEIEEESLNSLNIEKYIIATSTPCRNDSQEQTNNNENETIKTTTPAKRRSSQVETNNSSPVIHNCGSSRFDYRTSPVRRRLLEAHANDKNSNITPSPPSVFSQNIQENKQQSE